MNLDTLEWVFSLYRFLIMTQKIILKKEIAFQEPKLKIISSYLVDNPMTNAYKICGLLT